MNSNSRLDELMDKWPFLSPKNTQNLQENNRDSFKSTLKLNQKKRWARP